MKRLLIVVLALSSGYVFCCGDQKCGCSKPNLRLNLKHNKHVAQIKPAGEKCPCEERTNPVVKK